MVCGGGVQPARSAPSVASSDPARTPAPPAPPVAPARKANVNFETQVGYSQLRQIKPGFALKHQARPSDNIVPLPLLISAKVTHSSSVETRKNQKCSQIWKGGLY